MGGGGKERANAFFGGGGREQPLGGSKKGCARQGRIPFLPPSLPSPSPALPRPRQTAKRAEVTLSAQSAGGSRGERGKGGEEWLGRAKPSKTPDLGWGIFTKIDAGK